MISARTYVYLLALADQSKIKIGITKDIAQRLCNFTYQSRQVFTVFDLRRSVAVELPTRQDARFLEAAALHHFRRWQVPSPWSVVEGNDGIQRERGSIRYGAGGHEEWFDESIFTDAATFLSIHGAENARQMIPLQQMVYRLSFNQRARAERVYGSVSVESAHVGEPFSTEYVSSLIDGFFAKLNDIS